MSISDVILYVHEDDLSLISGIDESLFMTVQEEVTVGVEESEDPFFIFGNYLGSRRAAE